MFWELVGDPKDKDWCTQQVEGLEDIIPISRRNIKCVQVNKKNSLSHQDRNGYEKSPQLQKWWGLVGHGWVMGLLFQEQQPHSVELSDKGAVTEGIKPNVVT